MNIVNMYFILHWNLFELLILDDNRNATGVNNGGGGTVIFHAPQKTGMRLAYHWAFIEFSITWLYTTDQCLDSNSGKKGGRQS